jgi:hypothetical protein
MSKMDLDLEEVCNSIKNYQTNDMFVELILNYFLDIYEVIEEIEIGDPDSLKKKSLEVFERVISKRFGIIRSKISEELRVIVETELVKMVNEFFEGFFKISDISNEIWKKLIDVASDLYIDYYLRCVKV